MADYMPVFLPGEAVTFTASAAVTAGQILEVSGSGTVAPYALAAAPSVKVVGVAGHDAPANKPVTVYIRGAIHESVAMGTVTAGDQVTVPVTGDTAGSQVKTATVDVTATPTQATINAAINIARAVLGVALNTASNPAKVRWMSFLWTESYSEHTLREARGQRGRRPRPPPQRSRMYRGSGYVAAIGSAPSTGRSHESRPYTADLAPVHGWPHSGWAWRRAGWLGGCRARSGSHGRCVRTRLSGGACRCRSTGHQHVGCPQPRTVPKVSHRAASIQGHASGKASPARRLPGLSGPRGPQPFFRTAGPGWASSAQPI